MENLKHTKGEWICTADITPKRQNMIYVKGTNKLIAYVQNEDVETDEERTANAKLIASAPELLEALKKVYTAKIERGQIGQEEISIMINAIKKATE